jgi:ferredoxin
MTHVVTENCDGCRFTECVAVCPVECFHAAPDRLYIDPLLCIDCGACVPVCPVKAIVDQVDLAPAQKHWLAENRDKAKGLPVLRGKADPLPGAKARQAALGH